MSEVLKSNNEFNDSYDKRWDELGKVDVYKTGDHAVVFGEKKHELSQEELERKANTERQERKIISALLSDDINAISMHDVEGFDERSYGEFYEKRKNGEISDADEARMVEQIQTPAEKMGAAYLAETISYDKHMSKILRRFSGDNGSQYQWISSKNVNTFIEQFPTPFSFEEDRDKLLTSIRLNNSQSKYEEYVRDMDKFQKTIYGKRFEYYSVLKGLDDKAEDIAEDPEIDAPNAKELGETLIDRPDFAVCGCSRAETRGEKAGESEDGFYESEESGIIAIFDGAGGMSNGKEASRAASEFLRKYDEQFYVDNVNVLADIAFKMNDEVCKTGGFTTGVIAKIHDNPDGKTLDFINVGDSRLYLVRDNQAFQLSHDEGYGNKISNALGRKDGFSVNDWNAGIKLESGDRLLLCSDGITGDTKEDSLSSEDIAGLVGGGNTPAEAAKNCVFNAKKHDDRTALVKFID